MYSNNLLTSGKTHYDPFGMLLEGRNFEADYRFGFQNQEVDEEFWGGAVSFKYRVEDARLGRFFAVDPLSNSYPWNSPYAFCENKVGLGIELEGAELQELNSSFFNMKGSGGFTGLGYGVNGPVLCKPTAYEIAIVNRNVPEPLKYADGTLRFSVGSLDMTPTGGSLAAENPYGVITSQSDYHSPDWSWNQYNVENALSISDQGVYPHYNQPKNYPNSGFYMSVDADIEAGLNQSTSPKVYGKVYNSSGLGNAPQEFGSWVKMYQSIPIWLAIGDLGNNKRNFNIAINLVDNYIALNTTDILATLNISNIPGAFRANMINYVMDGTLPKITDETGKVNSDQLRWNLYYQYYGGQALRGLWKQESVDKYNKEGNLWEGN
ncbi:MAG TPA: hypothetical protein PLN38_01555 [Chitinophagales bacterium]|nr:hypothetical protein [Chitinophagales bacterium]